ncbi:dihydropteroate synthase [Thalassospiraceae bacterium LMO-JJ14]|nr:dihydropteroate synthase [Thalassospiraceae bacterium LMO-JJ14]
MPEPLTFAGLTLDRPRLMGVVNVTPDSFSDGGDFLDSRVAIDHALKLIDDGADILDIGGESTRPGSRPITIDEECARILPVIEGISNTGVLISVDTRHADVMRRAIDAGASIVNDVTALTGDPESAAVCAGSNVDVVLMHMQGTPETMQDNPTYEDAALDILDYMRDRLEVLEEAGLARSRISIDPGIGFGKNLHHNLRILSGIDAFHTLGVPLLLGVSRKSFISKIDRDVPAKERVAGSIAAAIAGWDRGVQIFRVHDVAETRQALAVWQAIEEAEDL